MPANIEIPLDLPEIRILKTENGKREVVITVESTREWAICARCGNEIREFHGITNLTHLFRRLYLDLEGYRLFGL